MEIRIVACAGLFRAQHSLSFQTSVLSMQFVVQFSDGLRRPVCCADLLVAQKYNDPLSFNLDQLARFSQHSAPRVDLNQTEDAFPGSFFCASSDPNHAVNRLEKERFVKMKAIVLSTKSSIHRPSLRRGFRLIPLVLVCFGLAPMAQAVGPDTDGNIPGSNNGEGIGVLVSRTTGVWNSGTGVEALNHLTAGNQNTATGLRALNSDINGGYTPLLAFIRSLATPAGFSIVPLAVIRSPTTQPAVTTPPTVMVRSTATAPIITRPLVLQPSTEIPAEH